MKKILTLTVTALLVFAFAFTTYAETKLTVTGQVRSRGEGVQKSFDANKEHVSTFGYLRTRINFNASVAENASAFVQLQDARMYGAGTQSSSLDNDMNVGIHQAYLKYNLWTKEKWSIGVQAGRFEYVWGNQRLLGSVGWSNNARSWEGQQAWYDAEKFNISLASLKKSETEIDDSGYDGDFDAYVAAVKLKDLNLDLLVFMEDNKDTADAKTPGIQEMKRTTLAAYYKRKVEQFDMEFNFAMQTGTHMGFDDSSEIDISAMMFAGEVGYSFEGERNAHVSFGIDYASGTDWSDTTNTEWKTFNNLYWTGHKFNGYMDYFLGGGPNGLMDISLKGKAKITNGWTVGANLHLFSSAEDYSYMDSTLSTAAMVYSKDVGTELDVFVKTSRVQGVSLMWGVSTFTAKDNFAIYSSGLTEDPSTETMSFTNDKFKKQEGTWFYCQATMNF